MTDVWTIGHSTQPLTAFVDALKGHRIELVVDVRKFPRSGRNPHFDADPLKKALFQAGIRYEWLGLELGGFRKTTQDSPHVGLQESSFRGYADHMASPLFQKGLARLLEWAKERRLAYMCSESNYKSCHRRLISDHLRMVEGLTVHHILTAKKELPHEPLREARVMDGKLLYAARPLEEFE